MFGRIHEAANLVAFVLLALLSVLAYMGMGKLSSVLGLNAEQSAVLSILVVAVIGLNDGLRSRVRQAVIDYYIDHC